MVRNNLSVLFVFMLFLSVIAVISGIIFIKSLTTRIKATNPAVPDYGTYPVIYARDDYNNVNPQSTYGVQAVGPIGGHIRKTFATVTSAEVARFLNAGQKITLFSGEQVDRPYMLTVSIYDYHYENSIPVADRFTSYFPDQYNELLSVPNCGTVKVPKYDSQELQTFYQQKINSLANALIPYNGNTIQLREHPNLAGIFIASGFEDETTPAKNWNHNGPKCNVLTKWKELHPDIAGYTEWIKFQMSVWRNAFPTKTIVIQPGAAEGDKMRAQLRDFGLTLNPPVGLKHNGMQVENLGYNSWISSSTNYIRLRGGQIQSLDSVSDSFNPNPRAITAMEATLSLSAYGDTAKKRSEFLYWTFLASLRANVHFVDLQDDWIYPQSLFQNKSPIEIAGQDTYSPWPGEGRLAFWKWYYENLGVTASNAKHAWVVFRDSEYRFSQSGTQSTSVPVVMREKTWTGANMAGHGIQKGYPAYTQTSCTVNAQDQYCDPSSDPANYPSKMDGNFNKYLKVIEPDPTELVLWNDSQLVYPQGVTAENGQQYTRQMKKLPGNKKLLLQLDKRSTGQNGRFSDPNAVIHIFYLNKGTDFFTVKYKSTGGQSIEKRIQKGSKTGVLHNGMNAVLHEAIPLTDADFKQSLEGNASLVVENDNGEEFFHMIWLESLNPHFRNTGATYPTVSPGPSITQTPSISPSPAISPTVSAGSSSSSSSGLLQRSVSLQLKIKLQGVETPSVNRSSIPIRIEMGNAQTTYPAQTIDFIYKQSGVWEASMSAMLPQNQDVLYQLFLKGPFHLRRKVCDQHPEDTLEKSYECNTAGVKLSQENTFDLTGILLYAGDIEPFNGVIDAYDVSTIRNNLGKTDAASLLKSDMNLDSIVDTQDFSLVLNNLGFQRRYDE